MTLEDTTHFPAILPSNAGLAKSCMEYILERNNYSKDIEVIATNSILQWDRSFKWRLTLKTSSKYPLLFSLGSLIPLYDIAFSIENSIIDANGFMISYEIISENTFTVMFSVRTPKANIPDEDAFRSDTINKHKMNQGLKLKKRKVKKTSKLDKLLTAVTVLCCLKSDTKKDDVSLKPPTRKQSNEKRVASHNSYFARLRIRMKEQKKKEAQRELDDYKAVPPPNFRIHYLSKYFSECNFRDILALRLFSKDNKSRSEYFWSKNILMNLGVNITTTEAKELLDMVMERFSLKTEDLDLMTPDYKVVGITFKEGAMLYK